MELGCGVGDLSDIHPRYFGLDLSLPALRRLDNRYNRVNTDMQYLPFRDNAVDYIFSWSALEHVPFLEKTLQEIDRVLIPGGVALLAPAWHCRPWAAKGLPVRTYKELSWPDRVIKATILIRNSLIYRSMFSLQVRLYHILRFLITRKPLVFDYRRLSPNLSEYVYTDCDAFTSMDPHAAILYYYSRGYNILSHPTFTRGFLARHDPVVIQKPN